MGVSLDCHSVAYWKRVCLVVRHSNCRVIFALVGSLCLAQDTLFIEVFYLFFISFFFHALSLKPFAKTFLITGTAYHNTLQITIISVSYNSSKLSWPLFFWDDFHCVINVMQVMLKPCSLFIFRIAKFAILFAFSFSTQIETGKKWFITLFWGWSLRKWVCFYKS